MGFRLIFIISLPKRDVFARKQPKMDSTPDLMLSYSIVVNPLLDFKFLDHIYLQIPKILKDYFDDFDTKALFSLSKHGTIALIPPKMDSTRDFMLYYCIVVNILLDFRVSDQFYPQIAKPLEGVFC